MNTRRVAVDALPWPPLATILVLAYGLPVVLFFAVYPLVGEGAPRYWTVNILCAAVGLAAIWAARTSRIPVNQWGISFQGLWTTVGWSAALWITIGLAQVSVGRQITPDTLDIAALAQQWFFVGMAEELIYRGYFTAVADRVFSTKSKKIRLLGTVFVPAALFAGAHVVAAMARGLKLADLVVYVGLVFLAGVFYTYVRMRTGNVILAGLVHGGWNVPLIRGVDGWLYVIVVVSLVELGGLVRRRWFADNWHR